MNFEYFLLRIMIKKREFDEKNVEILTVNVTLTLSELMGIFQ